MKRIFLDKFHPYAIKESVLFILKTVRKKIDINFQNSLKVNLDKRFNN